MIKCSECSNSKWIKELKESECTLSAENSHLCPNNSNDDTCSLCGAYKDNCNCNNKYWNDESSY